MELTKEQILLVLQTANDIFTEVEGTKEGEDMTPEKATELIYERLNNGK